MDHRKGIQYPYDVIIRICEFVQVNPNILDVCENEEHYRREDTRAGICPLCLHERKIKLAPRDWNVFIVDGLRTEAWLCKPTITNAMHRIRAGRMPIDLDMTEGEWIDAHLYWKGVTQAERSIIPDRGIFKHMLVPPWILNPGRCMMHHGYRNGEIERWICLCAHVHGMIHGRMPIPVWEAYRYYFPFGGNRTCDYENRMAERIRRLNGPGGSDLREPRWNEFPGGYQG